MNCKIRVKKDWAGNCNIPISWSAGISKPLLLKLTDLFLNRIEDFTAAHQLFYGVNID